MRIEQINLGSVDHVAEVGLYDVGEVPGHQDHQPQKETVQPKQHRRHELLVPRVLLGLGKVFSGHSSTTYKFSTFSLLYIRVFHRTALHLDSFFVKSFHLQ